MSLERNKRSVEQIRASKMEDLSCRIAREIVIKGEKHEDFIKFSRNIVMEGGPQTKREENLCVNYIIFHWKLKRLFENERNILNKQSETLTPQQETENMLRGLRYRRVRTIAKIDMTDPIVINLNRQQLELEKRISKTLNRLREEQKRSTVTAEV